MFPSGGAQTRPELLFAGRYAVDGALPWGGVITYYRGATERTPVVLGVFPMDVSRAPEAAVAFARFAQRLGQVRSRAVPKVLDAGAIDGVPYLAFEDTRGRPLSDLLQARPLSSIEILRLGTEILDALEESHARGLVHGDLTPHNVVVSRDSRGRLHSRVLGIGALSLLRATPESSRRRTGSGKFAIPYMAPELVGGAPTPASDLFSVGTLLHHMVLGAPPVGWEGEEGFEDLSGLHEVIARARSPRAEERYESAAAMRAALDWVEIESSKRNPETQDIAPWMMNSYVGSIPVPVLASSFPPTQRSSLHPPGTVLSGPPPRMHSGAVPKRAKLSARRPRWLLPALLLLLLGTLVLFASWHNALPGEALESTFEPHSTEGASAD
jgi:serine/threonine protein kinase